MPNNLQILAYVQAMKDRALLNLQNAIEREHVSAMPGVTRFSGVNIYRQYLAEIEMFEKFIKGGNQHVKRTNGK